MPAIQVGGYAEAGSSGGGADKVEDFTVAVERFAGPVFGDFREEAVFDRIPLGSSSGIVSDSELEPEGICELRLEFGFPGARTGAIATAGVG